jgi:hypothetical protein
MNSWVDSLGGSVEFFLLVLDVPASLGEFTINEVVYFPKLCTFSLFL